MKHSSGSARTGLGLVVLGIVAWIVGLIGRSATSGDNGANIGAGILQLAAYGLIALGLVVAAIAVITSRGRGHNRSRRAGGVN